MTFTWQGRRLATASVNGDSISFKYNSDGIRTQKTVDGVTTYFTLDGSKIISQKTGNTTIFFEYDATGNVATMIYNGQTYYYVRNLMGEIIGLVDDEGTLVARYYYDPWGEITGYDSFTSQNIAFVNPFMYKGYYYDWELGFYYLNSRYYDPEICRFINADGRVNEDILGCNMFAYCSNNPIMRADNGGEFWHVVAGAAVGALIGGISSAVGQAISGREINWGEVAVSAASGAITGAITAACPAMGAVATGIVHGAVGAATYAATELVNGRTPTVAGTLAAGVTSGFLAGGAKAIGNKSAKPVARPKAPQKIGEPFRDVGSSQIGVDPNTLTLNPNFTPHPAKYDAAFRQIKTSGMYGVVEVSRNGLVYNGQHRVFIGRQLGIAVDVIIR